MDVRVEKLLVEGRNRGRRAIVSRMRRVEMAIRAGQPTSRYRQGRWFTGL